MSSGTHESADLEVQQALRWQPRAWPDDPESRRRLVEFVGSLRAGLNGPDPLFAELLGIELDLRGADISGAPMVDALLNNSRLDGVVAAGSRLVGADLSYARLLGADFSGAEMFEVDLSHVCARGVVLRNADLGQAQVNHADLRDADLAGARLDRCNFVDTDLRGADLRGCELGDWIDLRDSRVFGARLDGLVGVVRGPADVSDTEQPCPLDGDELAAWFRDHNAPGLRVAEPR